MKKRLTCILLIAALIITVLAVSASAESSAANEKEIYTYLTGEMGFNNAAACGIMANIYYETNFTANISASGYYGLFMYWSGLTNELITWCGNNGHDYTTVHGQMKFFDHKMNTTYTSLRDSLLGLSNTAENAYNAAAMFCRQFERPANMNYEANKRGAFASGTLFPRYNGKEVGSGSTVQETKVNYTGYITASILNVRYGPGTTYEVKDSLVRGESVSIVAEAGTWCKLSSGGWVSKNYVSTSPVSTESNNASGSGTIYYVTASALNVRSAPGTSSSVVSCVYRGSSVSVIAEKSDSNGDLWCKLSSGGWVSKEYLSTSAVGTNSADDGSEYTVTASALNVRSGAGTGNTVIDCLWKGETAVIVSTTQDSAGETWGKLSSGGWVSMEYLD